MNDPKHQAAPHPTPQNAPTTTRDMTSSTQVQEDADDMADHANQTEQVFDDNHGIFDKI